MKKRVTLSKAYLWVLKNLFTPKAKKLSIALIVLLNIGLVIHMAQALVIGRVFELLKEITAWESLLWQLPLLYVALWVVSQYFDHLKSKIEINLWFDTYRSVNQGIFANLNRRSPFQLTSQEEIFGQSAMARFRSAVHRVKDTILFIAASEFMAMLIAQCFLFWFNWPVALIMCGYIVIAFFWASRSNIATARDGRELEKDFRKADRQRDVRLDHMSMMIHADMAQRDEKEWLSEVEEMRNKHKKMWFRYERHLFARNVLGIVIAGAAFLVTFDQYLSGTLSFAMLYPTIVWSRQVWDKTWRFANVDRVLQKIGLTIIEGVEAMLTPVTIQDPEEGIVPGDTDNLSIEFENVTFGHGSDEPILNNVSFTIHYGDKYGIVGPTGAGKSTLLRLIRGDVLPQKGRVLVNGVPTSKLKLNWWRRYWQYCAQDPRPYPDELGRVATYLCGPDSLPDEETLVQLLKRVRLDDLLRHKDGLKRKILNKGDDLSGGQKQRLMFLMAILDNPKMLMLDEPTSSLDSDTEQVLTSLLKDFPTVLVVAHRLGTVSDGYKIMVLEGGNVKLFPNLKSATSSSEFVAKCAGLQQVAA